MARWQVIDPIDGGVVFSADTIDRDPSVVHGLRTARAFAIMVARDNTDPMRADNPLRAVRVAPAVIGVSSGGMVFLDPNTA